MNKGTRKTGQDGAAAREDRLKAALKANLARRKAQARARAAEQAGKDVGPGDQSDDKA
ncbi:hypothetical protein J4E08_09430 [Sagittula sp. NFXS13]|uniref:hypothetical protein n=1 Tax=Sagittula sp. NFXS13 TaxID=2819095 RepID=UPI0032DE842B